MKINSDKEEEAKQKNIAEERNDRMMAIQEDVYNWKKYGREKYVHKIKMFRNEEQVQEQNRVVIPEDDYEWMKYGQKYNKSIQKNRSYFKCVNKNCKARKKVDWPPNEPNNIDISYEGDHNHRALATGHSENVAANENDLTTLTLEPARAEAGIAANENDLTTLTLGPARA
ncbi:hypothetical protein KFK09_019375 [Dendrobium nobile]|uniref:WRKY domain-containing protein n=1 Tax=Dendrobium nobile TaxID=94219 RepID=A0A8T3AQR9_DENNO|nr:hypothetical protein KFK09_019375 [Dendrobium nobile]